MNTEQTTIKQAASRARKRAAALVSVLGMVAATLIACGGGGNDDRWVGTWTASPMSYLEITPLPGYPAPVPSAYTDQTLRQVMRPTLAGSLARVHFSNLFGTTPLAITSASAAISTGGANIDAGTAVALQFQGQPTITIAAGAEAWSDTASLPVQPGTDIAISTYFAVAAPVSTVHPIASRTSYVAAGNVVNAASLPQATTVTRYNVVTGIDVVASNPVRTIVAFGDSITDGAASTRDALHSWPSLLAARLQTLNSGTRAFSVLNAGISGNRLLNDQVGPSGVSRFKRDVLDQSGATDVIILIGINDIGFGVLSGPPFNLIPASQIVSADSVIAALTQLLAAADAKGVQVTLGTILPFKGAGYYNAATEAKRQSVNAWIRSNASTRTVIDFDKAMGSPTDPLAINPAYDSGDHLHPNDAGYAAMANTVDISKFSN